MDQSKLTLFHKLLDHRGILDFSLEILVRNLRILLCRHFFEDSDKEENSDDSDKDEASDDSDKEEDSGDSDKEENSDDSDKHRILDSEENSDLKDKEVSDSSDQS